MTDQKVTFICAHCKALVEILPVCMDSGTTLSCPECGRKTVLLLLTSDVYIELLGHKRKRKQEKQEAQHEAPQA